MEALLQSATVKYQQGLYSEALADLNTFLNSSSPSKDTRNSALVYRATVYKRLGRLELALDDFNEILDNIDLQNVSLIVNRGIVLAEMGRYNESLFDMNIAVQADMNGVAGLIGRSFTYSRMRDYNSSANDLLQAMKKSPTDPRLMSRCAQVLNKAQRFDEAVAVFETSKLINPSDPKVFAGIAMVRKSQRRFSEAVRQSTIAIGMDSKLTTAIIVRAIANLNIGNLSDAVKDSERILKIATIKSPDAALAVLIRTSIFCLVGDYEAAIVNCTKAIEIWQDIGYLWFLRGAARCRQPSTIKHGMKDLQTAARLDTKLARACELLKSTAITGPLAMRATNPPEPPLIQFVRENDLSSSVSRRSSLNDIFEVGKTQIIDAPKISEIAQPSAAELKDKIDASDMKVKENNDSMKAATSMGVEEVYEVFTKMNWPEKLKQDFLKSVRDQKIDGKLLLSLEDADLEELGIASAFQRRRILLEIRELRESQQ